MAVVCGSTVGFGGGIALSRADCKYLADRIRIATQDEVGSAGLRPRTRRFETMPDDVFMIPTAVAVESGAQWPQS